MESLFYDKTEKGREEISSRKYQLSPKLRPLLVIIDGRHSSETLLHKLAAIGMNQAHLDQLLQAGFIQQVTPNEAPPENEKTSSVLSEASGAQAKISTSEILGASAAAEPNTASQAPAGTIQLIVELRQFLTESIKSNLGLRGFTLQLRLERAESLADFRDLAETLSEALYKSKGTQTARAFDARLSELLDSTMT